MPPDLHIPRLALRLDAVRVPHNIGVQVLRILGARSGAVVERRGRALYWFLPIGSAPRWDLAGTRALSASVWCDTARRPACMTLTDASWRVHPGEGQWVTCTEALRAAVTDAQARDLVEWSVPCRP